VEESSKSRADPELGICAKFYIFSFFLFLLILQQTKKPDTVPAATKPVPLPHAPKFKQPAPQKPVETTPKKPPGQQTRHISPSAKGVYPTLYLYS